MRIFVKYWYWSLLAVLSLVSYLSVMIPPSWFWPSVFLSYAIPGIIILNAALFVLFIFRWRRLTIFPLIGLLGSLPFIFVTISFHESNSDPDKGISILSFNTKLFRKFGTYREFSGEMINWVVNDYSDIKCIQEYSTDSLWEGLNITKKITSKGYHGFTLKSKVPDDEHNPGLGIFTKFELLASGIVWEDSSSSNGTIFVDVRRGRDTLRIYNTHFGSMSLNISRYKSPEGYFGKLKDLISKLKHGATNRSVQIDRVMDHIKLCPYRFFLCGDFNETPYSYNYFKLRSSYTNAFERAGTGFGFSTNNALFFLRIDHQFYGPGIKALNYRVDRSMRISDHFPTRGFYRIE